MVVALIFQEHSRHCLRHSIIPPIVMKYCTHVARVTDMTIGHLPSKESEPNSGRKITLNENGTGYFNDVDFLSHYYSHLFAKANYCMFSR